MANLGFNSLQNPLKNQLCDDNLPLFLYLMQKKRLTYFLFLLPLSLLLLLLYSPSGVELADDRLSINPSVTSRSSLDPPLLLDASSSAILAATRVERLFVGRR